MANSDNEPNYASDANDLVEVNVDLEADGYEGQFSACEGGVVCLTCHQTPPSSSVTADAIRRTEGASDPADMTATLAITCPQCNAKGTLVVHFGPEATMEEQDVFRAIELNRNRASGGQEPVA